MKIRIKIITVMIIISALILASGITYSAFTTSKPMNLVDQKIAKFVFDTKQVNYIELELNSILPNETKEFLFSVSNTSSTTSNISIDYQIKIKTYHFIPLDIKLYKVGDSDELIMTCDESYSRNNENEIVCNSPIQQMNYQNEITDDYKLVVKFEEGYDNYIYSELVDYIDLEINSWQRIEE